MQRRRGADGEHAAVTARPPPVTVDPYALLPDGIAVECHCVPPADKAHVDTSVDKARAAAKVGLGSRHGPNDKPYQCR
ncbi:hypothetical protein PRBRB14_18990 [Hallella multisaccharivorax DSM 17128]|nr:hypothetical protein PRBRB14_18990 [Hallella multisaccharivorax DSM 17128]